MRLGEPKPQQFTGPVPRWTLALASCLAVVCGATVASLDAPAPRIAAAVLLVLLLPGFALTACAFPARKPDLVEVLLSSLACSIVVGALGGLLLDVLPGHMNRLAWAVLLAAVTLLAAIAALVRSSGRDGASLPPGRVEPEASADAPKRRRPAMRLLTFIALIALGALGRRTGSRRPSPAPAVTQPPSRRVGVKTVNSLLVILAVLIVVASVVAARNAANSSPGFTELSLLPGSSAPSGLLVHIASHEHRTASLRLTLSENGRLVDREQFRLAPGQSRHLVLPASRSGVVVARVYRQESKTPLLRATYYPRASPARGGTARHKTRRVARKGAHRA
jgi:Protein of unknown function (DUF1616)